MYIHTDVHTYDTYGDRADVVPKIFLFGLPFKATLTREILLLVILSKHVPNPLIHTLKPFRIQIRIR
jgi:hypothetical protein